MPDDASQVIPDPAAAVAELLVEAWVRCYDPNGDTPPLIDKVEGIEWGDIDDKEFYPKDNC